MKKYAVGLMIIGSLVLGGCGDDKKIIEEEPDPATITIGGTLSGLDEVIGNGVSDSVRISLLAADGVETLELFASENGAFVFEDKLEAGESYAVSIAQQPLDQTCTIDEGSGEATGMNITNIVIHCI